MRKILSKIRYFIWKTDFLRPINQILLLLVRLYRNEFTDRSMIHLFENYHNAMVRITMRDKNGDLSNGAGFHIGDGVIVTAKHVIEYGEIDSINKGEYTKLNVLNVHLAQEDDVDLALIITNFEEHYHKVTYFRDKRRTKEQSNYIPLGFHLDDWLGDEFVLTRVLLMGYPIVPFSNATRLISVVGEVNAVIDKYNARHPHFIISPIARGGFSGGPVISEYGFLLGVLTESLTENGKAAEIGFASAISIEPLLNLLADNNIRPKDFGEEWDDYINPTYFTEKNSEINDEIPF